MSKDETIADILQEVRDYGAQPPPRLMWLDIADRIEAAHKREVADLRHRFKVAEKALKKIKRMTKSPAFSRIACDYASSEAKKALAAIHEKGETK